MSRRDARHAKLERKARKATKKNRRQSQRQRELQPSYSLLSGLAEAEELLKDRKLDEAAEVLKELQRRYPRRVEPLQMLHGIYILQQNMWSLQAVCQQIVELAADEEDTWLALAGAALCNGQMTTALRAFDHYVAHWPDSAVAAQARESRDEVKAFLLSEIAKRGIDDAEGLELFALHDAVNFHLHHGDYDRVSSTAEQLLRRWPTFAPALNNRCVAQFCSGQIERAIADARRVLEFDAENYHALANLTRFLVLSGRAEETPEIVQRLKAVDEDDPDLFVKKAEALSFLGDWAGVLEAFAQAERRDHKLDGLLCHLAGVAAANLGQPEAARKHWKRAIKLQVAAVWARENLADSQLPLPKQNGPWAFPVEYWIPQAVINRLIVDLERAGHGAKDAAVRRHVRAFFEAYPYLERLIPLLLEFGDSNAREFVVRIASQAGWPTIHAAVRKFALGRRGSDDLRFRAAMTLMEAHQMPPGPVRMWRDGEIHELLMTAYEITPEPTDALPEDVVELSDRAGTALQDRDGAAAESLLTDALRLHPHHPGLAFNRALAIALQGREDEALGLVREVHARQPDYLFARVRLAEDAVSRRDFEAAKNLLDPLLSRRRFHHSEFGAFCHAQMMLLSAEGKTEATRSWLDIWRQIQPDDPRLAQWERRLGKRGLFASLFRRD
jgi:tetratricopeptide (TPR) repeat protein